MKTEYRHRSVASQTDPQVFSEDVIRHPDAYTLAERLATRFGADNIIDIGLGSPRQLMALAGFRKIVIDYGSHLAVCRRQFPVDKWIEWNLEANCDLDLTDETVSRSVVICTGIVERLADPTNLMNMLSRWSRRAPAMIVTTTERDLLHGPGHKGPPTDIFQARQWNTAEFEQMLEKHGLRPTFTGLTVDDNVCLEKKTIISIFDQCPLDVGRFPPDDFRPLALVTTYNDSDIAAQIIAKFLDDGIDVVVHDNWSTDGTFEELTALAAGRSDLSLERFPEQGPSRYFDLRTVCRMKEEIAAKFPGRWIIHNDSDEMRCSPWPGISLRGGLYIAERMGYAAVDFTVCQFRPVDAELSPTLSLERQIRNFEYSRAIGHFSQIRVWRQGTERVDLASSGGHEAQFSGRKIFPYKFLLKHYPLRSAEQARRKIFVERRPRYAPAEREFGWHIHYDEFEADQRFVWSAADLIDFEAPATRRTYLVESIAGIGIIRNLPFSMNKE
jgi:hypothetical protein